MRNSKRFWIWGDFCVKKGHFNLFYHVFSLEQIVQCGCECPLSVSIQGQAGWGCEQPGLEGGVPAYSRGVGSG